MILRELIERRRVLVCVGSGGVGKTTTAAAIGVEAARSGRRAIVLTVDPAKRLKDALGIGTLDGRPRRVPLGRGVHLDAMLLDVKRTFDELVRGLATTPEQAARVLENRLYQNLSGTLAGTAEYMAIETVQRLVDEGQHDLLVVDTPPARHAVDFLDAPRRLLALLDSRAFGILKDPTSILGAGGSRVAQMLLGGILRGLERFTGVTLVREIGEFVGAIEALTGALRTRVARTQDLLRSDATSLVLVTAPEPRLTTETAALADALARVGLRIDGVIVNRALPRERFGPGVAEPPLPLALGAALEHRLRRTFEDLRMLADRQQATLAPLLATAGAPIVAEVPLLAAAPGSLDELVALGEHLVPAAAAAPPAATGGQGLG